MPMSNFRIKKHFVTMFFSNIDALLFYKLTPNPDQEWPVLVRGKQLQRLI